MPLRMPSPGMTNQPDSGGPAYVSTGRTERPTSTGSWLDPPERLGDAAPATSIGTVTARAAVTTRRRRGEGARGLAEFMTGPRRRATGGIHASPVRPTRSLVAVGTCADPAG